MTTCQFDHFLFVEDLQTECRCVPSVYRCQRLLQGASFQILVTAVSKSPSVLESIEADKAESVANLSGVSWTNCNPKVLFYFLENVHLNIVVHISVRKDGGGGLSFVPCRAPDFKHLRVKIDFKCFYSQKCVYFRKWRWGYNQKHGIFCGRHTERPRKNFSHILRIMWKAAASLRPI